ncbi:hypothetical protein GC170_14370 [bacterium]|nr:hypothetical protein [bacterium]
MVPVFVLWSNMHGGVLGGLATLALVNLGWITLWFVGKNGPLANRRAVCESIAITLTCFSSVLINPYFGKLPEHWFSILYLPLHELVVEHARIWRSPATLLMTTLLAWMYLAVWARAPQRFLRPAVLIPFFWLVQAFLHVRHASLFAIVTLAALSDILPGSGFANMLARRGWFFRFEDTEMTSETCRFERKRNPLLFISFFLLSSALILQFSEIRIPFIGHDWVRLDRNYWPVDILPQLHFISGGVNEPRLYNDMLYGGFLIFYVPELPVFIDDRCELYGQEFLRSSFGISSGSTVDFDYLNDQFDFTHVLTARSGRLGSRLEKRPDWRIIGQSPSTVLFGKIR